MIKKNVTAIAAISVIALAGISRWPVSNLQKISTEIRNSIVLVYSHYESTLGVWIARDQQIFKKNMLSNHFYMGGKDNSSIRGIRGVLTL